MNEISPKSVFRLHCTQVPNTKEVLHLHIYGICTIYIFHILLEVCTFRAVPSDYMQEVIITSKMKENDAIHSIVQKKDEMVFNFLKSSWMTYHLTSTTGLAKNRIYKKMCTI